VEAERRRGFEVAASGARTDRQRRGCAAPGVRVPPVDGSCPCALVPPLAPVRPLSRSAPAASPDKSFRCGNIWKYISRRIEGNQRVAGKWKPRAVSGAPPSGSPRGAAPGAASPDRSFRFGNIWKFNSRPIEANHRVAGKSKPRGGLGARRRPAARAPRPAPCPRRPCGGVRRTPSAQRALDDPMPADLPRARAEAAGGRRRGDGRDGHCGTPAGRINGGSIADLLELRKNFFNFLFYRRPGSAREHGRRAERRAGETQSPPATKSSGEGAGAAMEPRRSRPAAWPGGNAASMSPRLNRAGQS
jgi:hypothetical protein